MPITQDRMIAALSAAKEIYTIWKGLREAVKSSCADGFSGKITPELALQEIEMSIDSWQPNADALMLIAGEERHFKDNRASNILAARRAAKRRGKNPDDPIPLRAVNRQAAREFIKAQDFDPSKPKPGVPTLDELKALAEASERKTASFEQTHTIKQGNMTIERVMEPIPEPDPNADLL